MEYLVKLEDLVLLTTVRRAVTGRGEVRSLHDSLVGGLVRRGSGGSTDDLVLLSTVGRAVTCRGEVWNLHDGLVGGPAGTYIIYHD